MATYEITFEFNIDVKGLAKAVILDERTLPIKTKIFDAVMENVVIPADCPEKRAVLYGMMDTLTKDVMTEILSILLNPHK